MISKIHGSQVASSGFTQTVRPSSEKKLRRMASLWAEPRFGGKEKAEAAKKAEAWHAKWRDIDKEAAKRPWMTLPPADDAPSDEF